MIDARAAVDRFGLSPHPEGGWYRETWRAEPGPEGRSRATAILFLLEAGGRSHWHRVDADELWLWHDGSPLILNIAADDQTVPEAFRLAPDRPQQLVPAGRWQAAEALDGWTLVSCVVVPGFDFAGFTLAEANWAPGQAG